MSPRLVLLYTCFLSSPIDPIPGKSRLLILLQLNLSRLWAPIKGPTLLWSFSNSTPNISKHHQTVWVMLTLSSLCFLAIKYHKVSNVDSFDMFWCRILAVEPPWTISVWDVQNFQSTHTRRHSAPGQTSKAEDANSALRSTPGLWPGAMDGVCQEMCSVPQLKSVEPMWNLFLTFLYLAFFNASIMNVAMAWLKTSKNIKDI